MSVPGMKIWLDGAIVGHEEARLSVLDHGLLYGDGVFEGMRVYGGEWFRPAEHLKRLQFSASYIGLELPHTLPRIEEIVADTIAAYGADEAYIRLLVTRDVGELGVDPTSCADPKLVCIVAGIALYDAGAIARGIRMVTVATRKPPPDVLNLEVKSLNYMNSVMAKREAWLRGADEGLVLNLQGTVAEASVAAVFAFHEGTLVTPPTSDGALPGITRATVLEAARHLGRETRIRTIGHAELMRADEVFITGSGARMVPVGSLDGVTIGTTQRPVFSRLSAAFTEMSSANTGFVRSVKTCATQQAGIRRTPPRPAACA